MAGPVDCAAQQPQTVYERPLNDVLTDIEEAFHVTLTRDENDLKDMEVSYAMWRFTSDVETTLNNVLKPLDLVWEQTADNAYSIARYEYYRRTEAEGGRHLAELLSAYRNAAEFDKRREELRSCIFRTLGIAKLTDRSRVNAILRPGVKMDGYVVQNVAIESIPGYYVTGTLYKPSKGKGPFPVILCPHGHFYNEKDPSIREDSARYRPDMQYRCAALAKMGAIVLNYDMYAWGESVLFTGGHRYHETGFALSMQTWNSMRALDFLLSLPQADKNNAGVTGASGGGTQTILVAALDPRITASAPVVMVSSAFFGGCPCESGLPIHAACNHHRTNNAEIAAMTAPRPQLLISDGDDWTKSMPGTDFPYLEKIYGFYGKSGNVEQVYLPDDHHDYGISKRTPMYHFFAKALNLNLKAITGKDGKIDEHAIIIQKPDDMLIFGKGSRLPPNALRSHDDIIKEFRTYQSQ
jgi:dienelactone hydrolase